MACTQGYQSENNYEFVAKFPGKNHPEMEVWNDLKQPIEAHYT